MSSTPSTAASTPRRNRVASPIVLTPRSKIAALLADSDDDDEGGATPKKPATRKKSDGSDDEVGGGEDEEEPPLRLRGKIARRMYATKDSDDGENDAVGAYERVKQSLLAEKEKGATAPGSDEDAEGETESEDDIPVRPRGGLASRMYASSSTAAAAAAVTPAKDNTDTAYERVKRSLLAERENPAPLAPKSRVTVGLADAGVAPIAPKTRPSGGLFSSPVPSPARPKAAKTAESIPEVFFSSDSSDEELQPLDTNNARFMALVEKKRKEREAEMERQALKEAENWEAANEKECRELEEQFGLRPGEMTEKYEKKGLPRRNASKKALEEMHKETQRLARSIQLAHVAQAKKKITKQSLFDKFNFKTTATGEAVTAPQASKEPTSLVASESDAVATSFAASSGLGPSETVRTSRENSENLPDVADLLRGISSPPKQSRSPGAEDTPRPLNKGKGKAVSKGKGKATEVEPSPPPEEKKQLPLVKVILPKSYRLDDSDSDLEIVNPEDEAKQQFLAKQKLIASLRRPRPLPEQAKSPNGKAQVSAKRLHQQLLQKSRLQAIKEREDRIEDLRAKGVLIQTSEEREKAMREVESLVEKARKEALDIKRREQRAEKRAKGETVSGDEDEDDEEWLESEVGDSDVPDGDDMEYSGEEGEEEDGGEEKRSNRMIDGEADESGSEKEDATMGASEATADVSSPATFSLSSMNQSDRDPISPTPRLSAMPAVDDDFDDDDDGGFAPFQRKLPRKKLRVTDDEDGDENAMDTDTVVLTTPKGPKIPDMFKNMAQPSPVGMTQLFAGSMAGSAPPGTHGGDIGKKVDGMRQLPDDILQNSQAPPLEDSVVDSQAGAGLDLHYSQSQVDNADSLPVLTLEYSQSQASVDSQQMLDPTQDTGFERVSPAPARFETSPVPEARQTSAPTQPLDEEFAEPRKRGRLTRKAPDFSDEERDSDANDSADDADMRDAFSVMKKAAKKPKAPIKPYDKKNSEAKEMVHEQAEESEDEYGGAGGHSDDDDADGNLADDEEMRDMLDDEHQEIDEDAMAAFFAEREKTRDEKEVNRLFRDLQNGALRKKRGANFDLDDDSDDEYMAQERRRRQKRRQMAQIRKALLQDEKLGKIAADPKKAAFFKVLEDNDSDDEGGFLDQTEEDLLANLDASQSQDIQALAPEENPAEESLGSRASDAGSAPQSPSQQLAPEQRPIHTKKSKKQGLIDIREVRFTTFPDHSIHKTNALQDTLRDGGGRAFTAGYQRERIRGRT